MKDEKFFWLLFLVGVLSALIELFLMVRYANSTTGLADAVDALIHGLWYGIAIYEYRTARKLNMPHEAREQFRSHITLAYIVLFYGSLGYVALFQALPRFSNPAVIAPLYMLAGAGIGIAGNAASFYILLKARRAMKSSGECQRFLQFVLHAVVDSGISAAVLSYAIILYLHPWPSPLFSYDALLTFILIAAAGIMGYVVFKKGHHDHL